MNIVAHEDDDLLFLSPNLLETIASGGCVRTVFVTAGDAGLGETYYHGREEGSRAAYAVMAGVPNVWSSSEPVVAGHTLHFKTLVGDPNVSLVNMRLPDGGPKGVGYEVHNFQSLPKLWHSQHSEPSSLSPITSINAIDGSATYSYEGLLATLGALIEEFEPEVIATQNFNAEFGGGDHFDHIAAARFVQLAANAYESKHVLRGYMDYQTLNYPQNVFEPQLEKKRTAYYAYAAHDTAEACSSQAQCELPAFSSYWGWLKRQIVVSETSVPGANAGQPQSVASKATVTLDGSGSSDPLGHALAYEWKQTAGTAVTLSNPAAVKPTFTAPKGPASLTFSLVVKSSEATSQAASVTVTVAPVPTFALKVSKTGNGVGAVTSSPVGISCGSECEASFEEGTKVTLSPSPAAGSEFKGWSGACSGTGSCEVTMGAAKEVSAEFTLIKLGLKVTRTGGGSGTVSSSPAGINCGSICEAQFNFGTEVTISANSSAGSEFKGWSGAGCSGTETCKVTMSAAREVSAEFAPVPKFKLKVASTGNGAGSVSSSPAGINCGPNCEAEYEAGTEVTLSANPEAGSEFMGWSGAGCSGTGTCKVTVSAAKEVTADFTLERHQLSVAKSGGGSGTISSSPAGINCGSTCSALFDHGTEVTLSASPSAGSEFKGWSGAGCSGTGTCKVSMSAAKSIGAEFTPIPTYALKVSKTGNGSGTVSSSPAGISCGSECEASFEEGTKVTLSPSPAAGSEFKGWSGACSGTGSCKVTMSAAKEVAAEFALERHQLSVAKSGAGSGSVTSSPAGINCGSTCGAPFDHGTEVTLSAVPSAGSNFTKWTGACSGTGTCKVSMGAARSVGAEFTPVPTYALKVTRSGNGSGTVSSSPVGISCGSECEANFEEGTKVTLSPSPAAGSEFKGWSGACSGTGSCEVTMGAAKEVSAEFTLIKLGLKLTKTGGGTGTVSSSPAGIDCGSSCEAQFNFGTEVTISASPEAGSEFKGWSGAGCSGTGTCKVTMSAAREVSAEFAVELFRLQVEPAGSGTGTISSSPTGIDCGTVCAVDYQTGTQVTLTAVAGSGSKFTGWSGAGCSGTGTCEVTMSAAKKVVATFDPLPGSFGVQVERGGNGAGTVTSSPSGIDCGTSCGHVYEVGETVVLTAAPGTGSRFTGWSGAGCSGTSTCELTNSASVTATFTLEQRSLKVTKTGGGTGTVSSSPVGISCGASCEAQFNFGTEVTLSANPEAGSEFKGWSGAGCSGTETCKVTMSAAREVSAEFTPVPRFKLKVDKSGNGSGTVSSSPSGISCGSECEASFEEGTKVTLSPSPAAGSEFKGWSGACSGTGSCKVTMSAAKEVAAEFTLERHQLSVAKSGGGSGSVTSSPAGINCGSTCSALFNHGTEVTLSAVPSAGSNFTKWTGACSGTGTCKVSMGAARSVGAEFTPVPTYALKVTRSGNGSGTVSSSPAGISCGSECEANFEEGTKVTLSPSPAAGSEFKGWSGAGCSGTGTCKVTVSAAKEVAAEFTLERHQLSVAKSGGGSGSVTSSPNGINCGSTCAALFNHGTEVTLSAVPSAGSEPVAWTGCDVITADGRCRVSLDAARDVVASFNKDPLLPPELEPTPPTPSPPNVKSKVVKRRSHSITFAFRAGDEATTFRCALAKAGAKLTFKPCSSPVTFRKLQPGNYTFKLNAIGPEGGVTTAATRKFRIRG